MEVLTFSAQSKVVEVVKKMNLHQSQHCQPTVHLQSLQHTENYTNNVQCVANLYFIYTHKKSDITGYPSCLQKHKHLGKETIVTLFQSKGYSVYSATCIP